MKAIKKMFKSNNSQDKLDDHSSQASKSKQASRHGSNSEINKSQVVGRSRQGSTDSMPRLPRPQTPEIANINQVPELSNFVDQLKNNGQEGTENAFNKAAYRYVKRLGQGTYGSVKEAVHLPTGHHVAIKVIEKARMVNREARLRNELLVLMEAKHVNLLQLLDWGLGTTKIYIVTELVSGGELFEEIIRRRTLREGDAATAICSMLLGVQRLHQLGIVHRDIKPENVFLRDQEHRNFTDLVLGDFGISQFLSEEKPMLRTKIGSPGYMSFEVLSDRAYGKPADIWSIATVAYILLSGTMPWRNGGDYNSELRSIISNPLSFEDQCWESKSQESQRFIAQCLALDPTQRLNADQALNSPWIRNYAEQFRQDPNTPVGAELFEEIQDGILSEINAGRTSEAQPSGQRRTRTGDSSNSGFSSS